MTENERDNCLIQLVKSVNNLDSKLDDVNSNLNSRIDNLDSKLNDVNSNLNSRIDSIDSKLNENIEFTKRINGSVAVIEEEHGSKLKALFDGYKCNSEKLDKIETDIHNIQSILQKHDDEIFLIKSR